ncbi:MAG: hypothetical protein COV59_03125 [Candidatus Magasanikbacteria bacterium CG11_big_fil_rev_8_21_14_0_20_39_34]|uniref:Colicin V production protein n=1 Tax=Candidatus Magasanikbacteria bacterium CG11_big_fil_rev_8_21_14_0_20_39_34 TaxID=1974653 RepID=A0A2H0N5H8_9BACT|nr:MAG: hypothetical protein COV59_03125 [Candidatus Magasanikbacteria bacterium CG11_big_fil_rev_8_21_14_0_20_39_34]
MELLDIIILVVVGGFALFGFWFGFIHTLGSLLGTILGVYLSSHYYEPVASWIVHVTGWGSNWPKVTTFIVAFIVINRLVGLAFFFIDKVLHVVTRLPFIKSINRLLGLALGFFEGVISIGIILYFIERFPINEHLTDALGSSQFAPVAIEIGAVLWPLFPAALKIIESSVNYVEGVVLP